MSRQKIYESQKQALKVNKILRGEHDTFQKRYEANMENVSPKYCEDNLTVIDNSVEQDELKERLYDMLESLEEKKGKRWRIVVEQAYLQGKTLDEIGEMFGTTKQTI